MPLEVPAASQASRPRLRWQEGPPRPHSWLEGPPRHHRSFSDCDEYYPHAYDTGRRGEAARASALQRVGACLAALSIILWATLQMLTPVETQRLAVAITSQAVLAMALVAAYPTDAELFSSGREVTIIMLLASCAAAVAMAVVCPTCELFRGQQLPAGWYALRRAEYWCVAGCFLLCLASHCRRTSSLIAPWTALRCLAVSSGGIHCVFVLLIDASDGRVDGPPRAIVYPPGLCFWPALMLGFFWIAIGCCATPSCRDSCSLRVCHLVSLCSVPRAGPVRPRKPDDLHEVTDGLLSCGHECPREKADQEHQAVFRRWVQSCEREAELLEGGGGPCRDRQEALLYQAFLQLSATQLTLSQVESARREALMQSVIAQCRKASSAPAALPARSSYNMPDAWPADGGNRPGEEH